MILPTHRLAQLSDRRGRIRVLGITAFGLLVVDSAFILVALNSYRLPGGYWLLVIGSTVEGLFGGQPRLLFYGKSRIPNSTIQVLQPRLLHSTHI